MSTSFLEDDGRDELLLQIGECAVVDRAMRLSTVLGSCVAVSLWQRKPLLAGLFHALLPTADLAPKGDFSRCRYVDTSINDILDAMERRGAKLESLEARLFGGAFAAVPGGSADKVLDVGGRNVEAAREALRRRGVEVVQEQVGGRLGRKIVFDTGSGEVLCWVLQSTGPQREA